MKYKLGYCCKYLIPSDKKLEKLYNHRVVRISSLQKLSPLEIASKLEDVLFHNLNAQLLQFKEVAKLPPQLRMVRIGSELFPLFCYKQVNNFYASDYIQTKITNYCNEMSKIIKSADIRVTMHPGQFNIVNTDNDDLFQRTSDELKYHALILELLGLSKQNGSVINVHLGNSKQGSQGFIKRFPQLPSHVREVLSIENDEFSCGLDECLKVAHLVPIVLDIHHYWVETGEYISRDDVRINKIISSWGGVRPKLHYSQSRIELLDNVSNLPDMEVLLDKGKKKSKLRGHSDFYDCQPLTNYVLSFSDEFDIMCESKMKNLAVNKLYKEIVNESKNN